MQKTGLTLFSYRKCILKQIPSQNFQIPDTLLPYMQPTLIPDLRESPFFFARQCPFQIRDSCLDKKGRYIFVKGSMHGKPITLANIYSPNTKQVPFFRTTLQLLATFQEGILVLGGDFNVPLNPLQDTSTGTSPMPYKALCAIKTLLQGLTLHDFWGIPVTTTL